MPDGIEDPESSPREYRVVYPSGITSVVHWTFDGTNFRVTGQDFKPGGGEYEYIATIKSENLPALAEALGTDVAGIEGTWTSHIAEINARGFVSWLKAKGVEFEFFTWHDFDWFGGDAVVPDRAHHAPAHAAWESKNGARSNENGYYDRLTREFACGECGWSGLGSGLRQGELYRQVVEFDCPSCGAKVTHFAFPSREELEDAAARGIEEAQRDLQIARRRDDRWKRVLDSRTGPIADYPGPASESIRARIVQVEDDDGESWFVLYLNNVDVHRELAAYEDVEPAKRLLSALRDRYGARLRSFDYHGAEYYLSGDSAFLGSSLRRMVEDLPERDGAGPTDNRSDSPPKSEDSLGPLRTAAESGDTAAMFWLGTELLESDRAAAKAWLQRASEAGNDDAMNSLGMLLKDDDPSAARAAFEAAAAKGNVGAMSNLGLLLKHADPEAAEDWAEAAAVHGDTLAMFNRGDMLMTTHPRAAQAWLTRAADRGSDLAAYDLGLLLKEQPEVAKHWIERAARRGFPEAMAHLGYLLMEESPDEAREWLRRAADTGHADATFNLAQLEERRAKHWYEKLAASGDSGAMLNLAYLLRGSAPEDARAWVERAIAAGSIDAIDAKKELFGDT